MGAHFGQNERICAAGDPESVRQVFAYVWGHSLLDQDGEGRRECYAARHLLLFR